MRILLFSLLSVAVIVTSPVCFAQPNSWLFREVHSQKTNGAFFSVKFAPAGVPRLAATWGRLISQSPAQVETRTFIYDFPSMTPIDTLETLSASLAFTRDGKYLAMSVLAGGSREIQLWPYGNSGLPLRRLSLGETSSVFAMTTSRDDHYLYLAGIAGVRIIDISLDPPMIVDTLPQWYKYDTLTGLSAAHDVELNHRGDLLASVSGSPTSIAGIKVWNAFTNELVWEKTPDSVGIHAVGAYAVRWSPNDSELFIIVRDPSGNLARIERRSSSDGSLQEFLDLGGYQIPHDVWYLPGSLESIVSSCSDNLIRAWDPNTFGLRAEFRPHDTLFSMDVSPDGRYVATCGSDSTLRIFEVTTASSVSEPVAGESSVYFSAPHPNPAQDIVSVPFTLTRSSTIDLLLTDIHGRVLRIVASGTYGIGNYIERIETEDIPSGVYYIVLKVGERNYVQPVQIVR